ncbi:unnamed protein product [Caenorhabditis brenneri]
MSARFPPLPPQTLLHQLQQLEESPDLSDFDRADIADELRRLYLLTETLSSSRQPPAADQKNIRPCDTIPSGFTPLTSNAPAFDNVHGRLGLGQSQFNYKVTPEEVRRRIEGVEKLNTSNMASNLRKTKLKHGGEIMRTQLAHHGVKCDLYGHRNEAATRVISMVEGEALHLAADLEKICQQSYPARQIAEEVIKDAEGNVELMDALSDTASFLECMSAMSDAFKAVDPPLSGVVPKASKNQTLNHSMEKLSQATHGLGVATQRIWVDQMMRIGEEMAAVLNEQKK